MKKLVFLFPGQGAQYVGMMKDIVQAHTEAERVFAQAEEVLGWDIRTLIFDGPKEKLDLTENTQPCLLAAEVSVLRVLEAAGIQARVLLGFSLGEWTALVAAGVLSFEDALRLVSVRAQAMQRSVPLGQGGMAVILKKSAQEVRDLCTRAFGYVEPSNYNCPGQISVAGNAEGIESILNIAKEEKIAAQRIPVSIPSHCALMEPAAIQLKKTVQDVVFWPAKIPIVMNCCAQMISSSTQIKENVIRQLTSPVRMEESIMALLEEGFDTFVEIGPGHTLSKFVQKCAKVKGIVVKTIFVNDIQSLDKALMIYTE